MHILRAILQDESGATAIEYALIAVVVSVAAILAMKGLGIQVSTLFSTVAVQYLAVANR